MWATAAGATPPQTRLEELVYRGLVTDRLGPLPGDDRAREVVVFRQPAPSTQRSLGSDQARSASRTTSASYTSTYSTGRAKYSRSTANYDCRTTIDVEYEGMGEHPHEIARQPIALRLEKAP